MTVLKPLLINCSTTSSLSIVNAALERPIVPGSSALARFVENGITGAAMALPSFSAMARTVARPISVWPPFTFCGPRCSVPPLYTSATVLPCSWIARFTSGHVIISNSTRSALAALATLAREGAGACEDATAAYVSRNSAHNLALTRFTAAPVVIDQYLQDVRSAPPGAVLRIRFSKLLNQYCVSWPLQQCSFRSPYSTTASAGGLVAFVRKSSMRYTALFRCQVSMSPT